MDIGLTLYDFIPTSLDRGSTEYLRDKCIELGLVPMGGDLAQSLGGTEKIFTDEIFGKKFPF